MNVPSIQRRRKIGLRVLSWMCFLSLALGYGYLMQLVVIPGYAYIMDYTPPLAKFAFVAVFSVALPLVGCGLLIHRAIGAWRRARWKAKRAKLRAWSNFSAAIIVYDILGRWFVQVWLSDFLAEEIGYRAAAGVETIYYLFLPLLGCALLIWNRRRAMRIAVSSN